MAVKKYLVEMDEDMLTLLKNSGQISVDEIESTIQEGVAPLNMAVIKPAMVIADILKRYLDYVITRGAFDMALRLPRLDDDTLSDCISFHLKDKGFDTKDPTFNDEYRKIYEMIRNKFKIYG